MNLNLALRTGYLKNVEIQEVLGSAGNSFESISVTRTELQIAVNNPNSGSLSVFL
jgi:hypothetical protein